MLRPQLYPVLLRLVQEGAIESSSGLSDNNRRARFDTITPRGRRELEREERQWAKTSAIIARFPRLGETS